MKKNLFIVLAVAGALASCSNDETLEVTQQQQSKTIGFNSYVDKATRADVDEDALKASGNGFNVWGEVLIGASQSTVFEGVPVYWETSAWTYASKRYWQPGAKYAFTAIGPKNASGVTYNEGNGTSFTDNLHGSIKMNIQSSQADVDVVYDYFTRTTSSPLASGDDDEVPFSFNHILSRVQVVFENGFTTSGQNLKITGVTITSKKEGTLTLTGLDKPYTKGSGTWVIDNSKGNYEKNCSSISAYTGSLTAQGCIESTKKGAVNAVYLLPTQETLDIEFTVQLYSGSTPGNEYEHTDTHKATATISGGLQPGTSYLLTATINKDNIDPSGALQAIEFTVTGVTGWGTDSDVNVTL